MSGVKHFKDDDDQANGSLSPSKMPKIEGRGGERLNRMVGLFGPGKEPPVVKPKPKPKPKTKPRPVRVIPAEHTDGADVVSPGAKDPGPIELNIHSLVQFGEVVDLDAVVRYQMLDSTPQKDRAALSQSKGLKDRRLPSHVASLVGDDRPPPRQPVKENKRPRPQPQFVEEPDGGHTETLTEEEKRQKLMAKAGISQANPLAALGNILRTRGSGRESKSPRREFPVTKKSSFKSSKESLRDGAKDSPEVSRKTSEPKSPKMFRFGLRRSSSRSKKSDRDDTASDTSSVHSLNVLSFKEESMETESSNLTVSRSAVENGVKEDSPEKKKAATPLDSISATNTSTKSGGRNSAYFKPPEVEALSDLFASGELDALLKRDDAPAAQAKTQTQDAKDKAEVEVEKVETVEKEEDVEGQADSGSGFKRSALRSSLRMYEKRYKAEALERKKDKSPLVNKASAEKPSVFDDTLLDSEASRSSDQRVPTSTPKEVVKPEKTPLHTDDDNLFKDVSPVVTSSLGKKKVRDRESTVEEKRKTDSDNERRRRKLFDDELFQTDVSTRAQTRVKKTSATAPSLNAYAQAHKSPPPPDTVVVEEKKAEEKSNETVHDVFGESLDGNEKEGRQKSSEPPTVAKKEGRQKSSEPPTEAKKEGRQKSSEPPTEAKKEGRQKSSEPPTVAKKEGRQKSSEPPTVAKKEGRQKSSEPPTETKNERREKSSEPPTENQKEKSLIAENKEESKEVEEVDSKSSRVQSADSSEVKNTKEKLFNDDVADDNKRPTKESEKEEKEEAAPSSPAEKVPDPLTAIEKTELEKETEKRAADKEVAQTTEKDDVTKPTGEDSLKDTTDKTPDKTVTKQEKPEKSQPETKKTPEKTKTDKDAQIERIAERIRRRKEEREASRSTRSYDSRSRIEAGKVGNVKSKFDAGSPSSSPRMSRPRASTDAPRLATERKAKSSTSETGKASHSWVSDVQKRKDQKKDGGKDKETPTRIKVSSEDGEEDIPEWRKRIMERKRKAAEASAKTASAISSSSGSPRSGRRSDTSSSGRASPRADKSPRRDRSSATGKSPSPSSPKKSTDTTRTAKSRMREKSEAESKSSDAKSTLEVEEETDSSRPEEVVKTADSEEKEKVSKKPDLTVDTQQETPSEKPDVTSPKPEITSPKPTITSPKPEITSPKPKIDITNKKFAQKSSSSEPVEEKRASVGGKLSASDDTGKESTEDKDVQSKKTAEEEDVFTSAPKKPSTNVSKDVRSPSPQLPSNLPSQVLADSQSGSGSRRSSTSSEHEGGPPFRSRSISNSRSPTPTSQITGPLKLPADPDIPDWKKRMMERKKSASSKKPESPSHKKSEPEIPAWKKELLAKRGKSGEESKLTTRLRSGTVPAKPSSTRSVRKKDEPVPEFMKEFKSKKKSTT